MGIASAVDQDAPSPLALGTHEAGDLPPPIPFDPAAAPVVALPIDLPLLPAAIDWAATDGVEASWLRTVTKAIRPICVGALMAIPTVGTATVGLVAFFDQPRAMAMTAASVAFLNGIPGEVLLMITALATGYGLAKTVERTKGASQ